jgi:hypothetical protein
VKVENFRSILVSELTFYAITPHISQFWRAGMVGGYGTGVPERLASLPWPEGVSTLRMIELRSELATNPHLLSLLNVKYLVFVTPDFYFNTAPEKSEKSTATVGATAIPGEVVTIDDVSFGLVRNSVGPLPRHFFVPSVTGVREIPRLQGDASLNSLAEDFLGTQAFDTSGSLDIAYHGDVIDVRVTPSTVDRFVVLNGRYHPNWRARAQAEDIPIFPTNAVMSSVIIRW